MLSVVVDGMKRRSRRRGGDFWERRKENVIPDEQLAVPANRNKAVAVAKETQVSNE
jgi:hypothetical protein